MISELLYNLSTSLYFYAIKIASLFNKKAAQWVNGRKDIFIELEKEFSGNNNLAHKIAWFHCASLGEFEQGRPIIEKLKTTFPEVKIIITFFSPSGYEIRKHYPHADWVFYLPADSKRNAERFIKIIQPTIVIFVKYEFWYHYLSELKTKQIPTFLVAAIFRKDQPFFQWYGALHREMLSCFKMIFVQDFNSSKLLSSQNISNVIVAGDPRIDRVLKIALEERVFPKIEVFCGQNSILVAGSTWYEDEQFLKIFIEKKEFRIWKLIIAPHDISSKRVSEIKNNFGKLAIEFSCYDSSNSNARVLIIDSIGKLAWLYRFGKLAYVGGGFGGGIHNTLEPMAFNLPVIYGPKYAKFREAVEMQKKKGHFTFTTKDEFNDLMSSVHNEKIREAAIRSVKFYMRDNKGATTTIIEYFKNNISIKL